MQVVQHPSAGQFLDRAERWLLRDEAEYNLLLGIASDLLRNPKLDTATLLATIESKDGILGCAFRTPPYKLGLTRMPLTCVPLLSAVLSEKYESLPGVLGPTEVARYFARTWCGARDIGFWPTMNQRIYRLESLSKPDEMPEGALRIASSTDMPLVVSWLRSFFEETRMPVKNARELGERLLRDDAVYLWQLENSPVSMAAVTGRTRNGRRIGFVYTPLANRQHGYASAVTSSLTELLLEQGHRFCFLYTDEANATSNHIYQKLGYQPVVGVVDYQFDS